MSASVSAAAAAGSSAANDPYVVSLERPRKPVLMHEVGAGAPCLSCGDKCPGLELHFWRKICNVCKCRLDEHDVQKGGDDPGQIRVGRLFDANSTYVSVLAEPLNIAVAPHDAAGRRSAGRSSASANSPLSSPASAERHAAPTANGVGKQLEQMHVEHGKVPPPVAAKPTAARPQWTQSDARELAKYAWVPPGAEPDLVREYMSSLDERDRPVTGGDGEIKRRRLIEEQVPLHDIDPAKCGGLDANDLPAMEKYVKSLKTKVVGMGRVQRVAAVQSERADKLAGKTIDSCAKCHSGLEPEQVAVSCERGAPDVAFHPSCFRCHTCDELLTDLIYYYNSKTGQFYCGRHFGDLLYPRCAGCDELIFSEQYTLAEGKNYHLTHFCCFGCDKPLGGHRYMHREPHVYCIECYMRRHAHVCASCGDKIAPDTMRIDHKESFWHADAKCFRCQRCHKCLVNQHFVIKNRMTFCSIDCKRYYFEKGPTK